MNRSILAPLALALGGCLSSVHASWAEPFISELHYDNAGSDVGELVAVTGPLGADLSGWQLVLYNGADGQPYRTLTLSGVIAGDAVLGESVWSVSGMQNGPDAVALVAPDAAVVDFVAYEAAVTALAGAAAGMDARLLPLAEDGGTPVGSSLQRIGRPDQWDWVAALATPGLVNPGLEVAQRREPVDGELPAPGGWLLWLVGLGAWRLGRRSAAAAAGQSGTLSAMA